MHVQSKIWIYRIIAYWEQLFNKFAVCPNLYLKNDKKIKFQKEQQF